MLNTARFVYRFLFPISIKLSPCSREPLKKQSRFLFSVWQLAWNGGTYGAIIILLPIQPNPQTSIIINNVFGRIKVCTTSTLYLNIAPSSNSWYLHRLDSTEWLTDCSLYHFFVFNICANVIKIKSTWSLMSISPRNLLSSHSCSLERSNKKKKKTKIETLRLSSQKVMQHSRFKWSLLNSIKLEENNNNVELCVRPKCRNQILIWLETQSHLNKSVFHSIVHFKVKIQLCRRWWLLEHNALIII